MMLTLFGLLSIMVWVIVGVYESQTYIAVQNGLHDSMDQIADLTADIWNPVGLGPFAADSQTQGRGKMDEDEMALLYENPVYLILFDSAGVPVKAYSSGEAEEKDAEKIVKIATEVAADTEVGEMHIGSLYTDKFIWNHLSPHAVLLVDTTGLRHEVVTQQLVSALIGLGFECLLFVACRKASDWMIGPIEETFEKQKQFIADASHELKTPVAVILANAEAMEKDPDPKWLANIEEEAARMNGLITDLLDMTRNEQAEFNPVEVNLSRLVEKQCLIQEAVMFERQIDLSENIEPDLKVMGQASMLEQVIAILLDNAAAHSSGKIIVTMTHKGKDVILDVANTGVPIPPEAREKIFERFYRADESRNRSSGRYGLGLAIARSIVVRHKGKIEALCANGLTTFRVTLRAA